MTALMALPACTDTKPKDDDDKSCTPDDADGIIGGTENFQLTVDDTGFTPAILKAQNRATITLTVKNTGTKAHSFAVDCLPTPNNLGCPTESCFPNEAKIPTIAAGASATTTFTAPIPEGIYVFRSNLAGDTQNGQFVIQ